MRHTGATVGSIACRGLTTAVLSLFLVEASRAGAAATFKAGTFDPPRLAPDFSLQGSDGQELRITRFRGKIVLLADQIVPERLKKFLGSFDKTFIGGTGTEAQLAAVRQKYGVTARRIPYGDSYTYAHSSFTYLIDRSGRIRGLMPYGHSADDYVSDLTILLKE